LGTVRYQQDVGENKVWHNGEMGETKGDSNGRRGLDGTLEGD